MKDANNISGNLKILYRRYLKKRKNIDSFNTNQTDNLFRSFLEKRDSNPEFLKITGQNTTSTVDANCRSLLYWFDAVEKKYKKG